MTCGLGKKPDDYQQALAWAEAGEYCQAFEGIQAYLEDVPDDAEALNDAGTILWCQGDSRKALPYLEKA